MLVRKGFVKGLIFGLLAGMVVVSMNAYAYDNTKPFDATDISTWSQRKGYFPENTTLKLANGTGGSIEEYGSDYFSIASMLIKCGEISPFSGKSPIDLIKKANSRGLWKEDYGNFDVSRIEDLYNGVLLTEAYVDLSNLSLEDALLVIKGKFFEGYLIQVSLSVEGYSRENFIFVDGYENDEMVYTDSAFPGTKWSDFYETKNTRINYMNIFESEYGLESYLMSSVYEEIVPTGKDNNDDEVERESEVSTESSSRNTAVISKSPTEFINVLKKYSKEVAELKEDGILWVYSTKDSSDTYKDEVDKAKNGVTAEVNGVKKNDVHRALTNEYMNINWALKELGILPESSSGVSHDGKSIKWGSTKKELIENFCEVIEYPSGKTVNSLSGDDSLKEGDICFLKDDVVVFAGGNKWYDSGKSGKGTSEKLYTDLNKSDYIDGDKTFIFNSFEPVESVDKEKDKIYTVIRIKAAEGLNSRNGELQTYNVITSEWDLIGMPLYKGLSETQSGIVLGDDLSSTEEKSLEFIKSSYESSIERVLDTARLIVVCIGMILMIYGIIVCVAYLFDRSNNFSDISLISLVSFGMWGVSDGYEDGLKINGKLYLTVGMLLKRFILLELVGLLMVSGVIYGFIRFILYRIGIFV